VTLAIYLISSERAGRSYDAFTTLTWGFGFATLFWLLLRPPWTFPFGQFASSDHIALGLGVTVLGTLAPFLLGVTALRHLPAPRVAVVATLEPVIASVLAWVVHGEALGLPQIAGGALVVTAVGWVQSHRPELDEETISVVRQSNSVKPVPR
jgi:drug/metabolite transporter (DMT)-like permease